MNRFSGFVQSSQRVELAQGNDGLRQLKVNVVHDVPLLRDRSGTSLREREHV